MIDEITFQSMFGDFDEVYELRRGNKMTFTLKELEIIEKLLSNKIICSDPESELLHKIRRFINEYNRKINKKF